ncbi:hypoxanthine phosphoribosyltransferase [Zunongwangia sp.]|uniref:hypoxanthine phosphoribosyltransferase n=1 Tax=Zunongwangia sp. TaxID=1965325 RepID=UPI003AA8BE43
MKLHDLVFEPYINEDEINKAIDKISNLLNNDYKNETPVFLSVLNGSFMFSSEIMKKFNSDCSIQFVKLSSYEGTSSSGEVQELIGLNETLAGKNVVILEDIVDTGNTLKKLDRILKEKNVKSYKIASLFLKPAVYKGTIPIDYIGIEIPDEFIVGYGLDYDDLGRNLTSVYRLKS